MKRTEFPRVLRESGEPDERIEEPCLIRHELDDSPHSLSNVSAGFGLLLLRRGNGLGSVATCSLGGVATCSWATQEPGMPGQRCTGPLSVKKASFGPSLILPPRA